MNINDFREKLRDIGVDVPAQVLKNWAYTDQVIPSPEPEKHGKGSGMRGRSASWKENDIPLVAAVYAIRHLSAVKYRPMLELVPDIKQSTRIVYRTPTTGYVIPAGVNSPKEIKIQLRACPEHLCKRLSEDDWQQLQLTWIATMEKAKRGIRIDTPKQVRFNWSMVPSSVQAPDGTEYGGGTDYVPEIVDDDVKDDKHVSLLDADQDEIVIIIDGDDSRVEVFGVLAIAQIVDV